MPIDTRQFVYPPRPLRDGRFRVREGHTTDKGRVYLYPYKFAGTVAEATAAMNARDWSKLLIKDELADFERHVLDGNTPGSFVWTDQTQLQGFRRFLRFFASTDYIERATPLAPIILGFTLTQIETNAGITTVQAQVVLDRANNLVSLNTAQDVDVGERQDLEEEV